MHEQQKTLTAVNWRCWHLLLTANNSQSFNKQNMKRRVRSEKVKLAGRTKRRIKTTKFAGKI